MNKVKTSGSRWAMRGFYTTAAGAALVGQVTGASEAFDLHRWFQIVPATLAVASVEFAGIMLAHHAQERRALGEKAFGAQAASAAVVAGAVAFQLATHSNPLLGRFFAGLSALAYVIYLLDSNAQRRDARRATNDLVGVAPDYGWYQWVRHFSVTRRAKVLALADPTLGLLGSLKAVEDEDRNKARSARVADVLDDMLEESLGKKRARLAREVYDLVRIADGLTENADYAGLIKALGAELVPSKIAPAAPKAGPEHEKHCLTKGAFGRYTDNCWYCTELAKAAKARAAEAAKAAKAASKANADKPEPVAEPVAVPSPPKLVRPKLEIASSLKDVKDIWNLQAVGSPGSPAPSGAQNL